MARPLRRASAGYVYHVLNRGNGRGALFRANGDFAAFVRLLAEGVGRYPVDVLAYCLMGNHWHLLLRPRTDAALPRFMAWLGTTHARRHHAHRGGRGSGGHVYQGRYKSFPVADDAHFLTVARYVEANPLRAGLVRRAEDWPWGSLRPHVDGAPIAEWPVDRPGNWRLLVNAAVDDRELSAVRASVTRGSPYGSDRWTRATAARMRLQSTLAPRGRPRKPLAELSPRQRRRRRNEGVGGQKRG